MEQDKTQNTTQEQEPVISETEMKMPEESFTGATGADKTAHLGAILGVLIVILVLILGGLYIWGNTMMNNIDEMPMEETSIQRPTPEENNEPESNTADAQIQALETVSTSNEIEAIEADIESTELDSLDAELNAIDSELEDALNAI